MFRQNFGQLAHTARQMAGLGIFVLTITGCAAFGEKAPEAQRDGDSVTASAGVDFSAGVRCMDNLLSDYGVRDISVLVEDLVNPDRRVDAGTREILVSVVSDLTQRSGAIRLVALSKDWGNTANLLAEASRREPFATVPQYALRGSVFMQEEQSVLGLDMTLLATDNMTVVPGTASRNTVRMLPGGRADIRKMGVTFELAARDQTQALRQLVQLASVEIIGRLAKVPYWTCLGIDSTNQQVAIEQQNWYDAMAAQPVQLIRYFQTQMRLRSLYDGPLDGSVNEDFKESVSAYREVLGLSAEAQLSLDFFEAYLAADHQQLSAQLPATAPLEPVSPVPEKVAIAPGQPPATSDPGAPLSLKLITSNSTGRYAAGDPLRFTVRPSRTAHVYCFLQNENRQIVRFFPSRFQHDSRVTADGVQLPGAVPFEIRMNQRRTPETVACYATDGDVLSRLPGGLNAGDLTPLPAADLNQVREAFAKVSGGVIAHEALFMQPR